MKSARRSPVVPSFMIIVFTALAVQFTGTYFARYLMVGDYF